MRAALFLGALFMGGAVTVMGIDGWRAYMASVLLGFGAWLIAIGQGATR